MRPLLWLSQLGFKMEVKCNRAKLHEDRFTSLRQAPPWSTLNPDINAFFLYRALESLHHQTTDPTARMSLVSGPGRGGMTNMPEEMQLFVDKHVRYIQSLDTVRTLCLAAQATSDRIPR
jgi:hypothetical protein